MSGEKIQRFGNEAKEAENFELDDQKHGNPIVTKRDDYRRRVRIEMEDEDDNINTPDDMSGYQKELDEMIEDGSIDHPISTTSTARTTGATGPTDDMSEEPEPTVEDLSEFDPNEADGSGKRDSKGMSKLARSYHKVVDKAKNANK